MNKESDAKATKSPKESNYPDKNEIKSSQHAKRYLIIGISLAVFNYGFYSILANLIIKNNDFLWLSNLIATAVTTILAYILHSKITWKERSPGRLGIYKFFIWNAILTFVIGPLFTQLFSLITPLYQFAHNISTAMNLPFTYEFVQSTGAFLLTTIVITILNFFCYDLFVFGKTNSKKEQKK